jgi:hypothetical protein
MQIIKAADVKRLAVAYHAVLQDPSSEVWWAMLRRAQADTGVVLLSEPGVPDTLSQRLLYTHVRATTDY